MESPKNIYFSRFEDEEVVGVKHSKAEFPDFRFGIWVIGGLILVQIFNKFYQYHIKGNKPRKIDQINYFSFFTKNLFNC